MTVRRVQSGLARLAVFVRGEGRPVIFLHAGVADSRMWRDQVEAVGAKDLAIAYDRRGFGETMTADGDFSQTGDLLAVLDDLAPGRPAIAVGCSQGGRIAIDMALGAPERISALVVVAPAISGAPEMDYPPEAASLGAALEAAEAARDVDRINELEAQLWLDGPLAMSGRIGGAVRSLFSEMNGIALRAPERGKAMTPPAAYERLGKIAAPTLVVWGDLDFPDLQARCRHLTRAIPGAEAAVLAGAAHLPSMECPAAMTDLILQFIQRLKPS
jgi:pimeloyl-ACP methyl ester carboxylesterase